MQKVYLYESWHAFSKNPPNHGDIDDENNQCDFILDTISISSSEIYHDGNLGLEITANCEQHGIIKYYVKFLK